jgi:UDPglucose 6-dehydrogenase
MKTVAMIGVGKLGQDCAEVMAAAGYDVVGYDVEPRTPEFPMCNTIQEAVKDRDFIFIAAPTPHDSMYGGETPTSHLPNKDFDYTIVTNILNEVNLYVNKSQLVILISTVLPGTVRNQLEPCITNARFIYNPYLIAMGTIKWDMVNPEMVIIGTESGSLTGDAKELINFYKVFMENDPRYEVGTWDEAESIKIFYNTFISTKLALVNMIQDVAETNGNINVDVVTTALAKSTYRIMGPMYMKAAFGDAGACHPRDNIALRYLADRLDLGYDLFDSIMTAREVQAERMALRCLKNGKNVTIIGKAYKPGVPYTNGSASMLVGYYIEKHGGNVNYYDENTKDLDLKLSWTEVYLIGYWEDWVYSLMPTIGHQQRSVVIIDPWRNPKYNDPMEKIMYGNTRPTFNFGVLPNDLEHWKIGAEKNVIELFPKIEKYKDIIHIIDAEVGPTNFGMRPTELIVEEMMEAKRNGKTKFLFYNLAEGYLNNVVEKIHRIANIVENQIDSKDIFYLCASPGSEKTYENIFNIKNLTKTNWKNKISILATASFQYFVQHNGAGQFKDVVYTVKEKPKKFLCFNKLPRAHRVKLIEKFLEHNILDEGFYSFLPMNGMDTKDFSWIDTLPDTFVNVKANKDKFPLKLNLSPHRSMNPSMLDIEDLPCFDDSYFSIVTETTFYSNRTKHSDSFNTFQRHATLDDIFITEKTFKCIPAMHPFIIFSYPGILSALRTLGYKTFSPMIDETYDTIINDDERFNALWNEITRLLQKTPEEWIQWQTEIKEIVEYNKNHFYSNTNHNSTKDISCLFE